MNHQRPFTLISRVHCTLGGVLVGSISYLHFQLIVDLSFGFHASSGLSIRDCTALPFASQPSIYSIQESSTAIIPVGLPRLECISSRFSVDCCFVGTDIWLIVGYSRWLIVTSDAKYEGDLGVRFGFCIKVSLLLPQECTTLELCKGDNAIILWMIVEYPRQLGCQIKVSPLSSQDCTALCEGDNYSSFGLAQPINHCQLIVNSLNWSILSLLLKLALAASNNSFLVSHQFIIALVITSEGDAKLPHFGIDCIFLALQTQEHEQIFFDPH